MHEMSIAVALIRQLESLARERGLERIDEIALAVGSMRAIVPEALEMAFEVAAAGTCAAGAVLNVETVCVEARCRECGLRFEPGIDDFLCRGCNTADVEIIQGNDIVLTSLTGLQKTGICCDED